jgi:hypothetical protein
MKKATFTKARKSARGANGQDGINGLDGINGENGLDGKDGRDGLNGKDGRDGLAGINGHNGIDGKDGKDGERGIQGLRGRQGDTGLQGDIGPQGERGPKGDKGDTGPMPDHEIDKKAGKVRFRRDDGTWGAWLEVKREIIDRTVTVKDSGGRGEQVTQAIADLERLNYNIQPIKTVVEDYPVQGRDFTIVVDASSTAVTVTLPSEPTKGKVYNIACLDSTNAVQVDFNGKNFYDSSDDETLFKGENLKVQYDGTKYIGA